MSFDHPWLIGNGVEHPVEVARLLAFASTGGAEGIVTPGDLKVQPLATPGTKIRVAPGAALMLNKYPGGGQQTYAARSPIQEEVSIRATGSSGARSDLVVARVLDPQYEGQAPGDVQAFQYARIEVIEGVSKTQYPLPLNYPYPAIPLARIDLPANTGTVTAGHIVDMRSVAQPRKDRQLFTHNLVKGDGEQLLEHSTEQTWPLIPSGRWFADVPSWATGVRVVATWGGVRMPRSAADGMVWVRLGGGGGPGSDSRRTQNQAWSGTMSIGAGEVVRESWSLADDISVPASHRGTAQPVRMLGNKTSAGGPPALDHSTSIMVDLEFYEAAV